MPLQPPTPSLSPQMRRIFPPCRFFASSRCQKSQHRAIILPECVWREGEPWHRFAYFKISTGLLPKKHSKSPRRVKTRVLCASESEEVFEDIVLGECCYSFQKCDCYYVRIVYYYLAEISLLCKWEQISQQSEIGYDVFENDVYSTRDW